MGDFWRDLRYGLRMLAGAPGFTAVAVVALALGIGANTVIFSFVNARLLQPPPFQDPERLVWLWQVEGGATWNVSYPDFTDWREQNRSFQEMAALSEGSYNLTGIGEPEWLIGRQASASVFAVLGVKPAVGRGFLPEEDKPGANRVVALSHGLWQRRFGGQAGAIGQSIRLNQELHTIIGVLPRGFRLGRAEYDLWVPLVVTADTARRGNGFLQVLARLKPGVSMARAREEMKTISGRLASQYPSTNARLSAEMESLRERAVRPVRPALLVLMSAVGAVLLIACANVANLLLARAVARQKEIAIRASLGATRGRTVRQMLTESALLGVGGGSLGLLLAVWGVRALHASLPEQMQWGEAPALDLAVVGFTALVSLITVLAFGLAPALSVVRADLHETLKETSRSSAGMRHGRLRAVLIVSEVALAVVLLTGAGLLIKSFARLTAVDPGFRAENVLTMGVPLSRPRHPEPRHWRAFFEQALERIRALPGVRYAAATSLLPMSGSNATWTFSIEGRPEPPPGRFPSAGYRNVTPDYFRAMGIPLVRGRHFTEQDREGAPFVVIINETMARQYWPNEDPVGKRIKPGGSSDLGTVVGVAGDIRFSSLERQAAPEMFWASWQRPRSGMMLVIRTESAPAALAPAVRAAIRAVDPEQPVALVRTLERIVDESVAQQDITMLLVGGFAGLALALAGVGLYGVMSCLAAQRTHEIGVRMALGAQRGDVLRLVVWQAMVLAITGAAIGWGGALALTRLMASLLFGITARDPVIFVTAPLVMLAVALAASFFPARRASKVHPLTALRYQ